MNIRFKNSQTNQCYAGIEFSPTSTAAQTITGSMSSVQTFLEPQANKYLKYRYLRGSAEELEGEIKVISGYMSNYDLMYISSVRDTFEEAFAAAVGANPATNPALTVWAMVEDGTTAFPNNGLRCIVELKYHVVYYEPLTTVNYTS